MEKETQLAFNDENDNGNDQETKVSSSKFDIFDICAFILTTELCIGYLRRIKLLSSRNVCQSCELEMVLVKRGDTSDGEVFRCRGCQSKMSIRKGSIFENSRLPMKNLMLLIYFFGIDLQIYECLKLVKGIAHTTVIEWFSILRGICSRKLIDMPWKLRGDISGNIIEIDESLFGKKRKYHRGAGPKENVWVFGAKERNTRNAFMQIVQRRDRDTLLPIIKAHIEVGSTIYSDQWGAYCTLNDEGYKHDTVNHSKEFKSSTGVCTNGIEGLWGNVKLKIKKMKGVLPSHVPEVLDEYMYRYRFGKSNGDVYDTLVEDIAKYH